MFATMTTKKNNTFNPIPFDPKDYAAEHRTKDPEFKVAYDSLEDEFSALAALLEARAKAGLMQAEIASRMGIS
jgi:hypothetical protein